MVMVHSAGEFECGCQPSPKCSLRREFVNEEISLRTAWASVGVCIGYGIGSRGRSNDPGFTPGLCATAKFVFAANGPAAPILSFEVWRLCSAVRSRRDLHAAGPGLATLERQLEKRRLGDSVFDVRRPRRL